MTNTATLILVMVVIGAEEMREAELIAAEAGANNSQVSARARD